MNGYIKLEYIESDKNQYIDTGFKPNGNTRIEMDAQMNGYTSEYPAFFGVFGASNVNAFSFLDPSSGDDYYAYYYGTTNTTSNRITSEMFDRGIIIADKGTVSYHGIERTLNNVSFSSTLSLYLFGINNNGTFGYAASMKLYSCRIYDNGTLIRDYIPVKNSEGVCGLYDLVENKFYSSSGSKEFIGGKELQDKYVSPFGFRKRMIRRKRKRDYIKHYVIKDGKLVDNTITLDTIRYGSQWSSSDNRKLTYESGYIKYNGSCYNRSHGVIFKPLINSKDYHTLFIEADFYYNSSLSQTVAGAVIGTQYGKTNSGWIDTEMNQIKRRSYYIPATSKFITFDISNLDTFCLFIGAVAIANPDNWTTVNIYNVWLEGGTYAGHTELNYIQYDKPSSTDIDGFIIDTDVYCSTFDYKLEYNVYGAIKWGYVHNNASSGTWLGQNYGRTRWNTYNNYYDLSNDDSVELYHVLYDMQTGVYKNGILVKEFTASAGSDAITDIPIYYGGLYDFDVHDIGSNYSARTNPVRYYPLKIYKGGELIKWFVPVIKDNEYCMYDKIGEKYYYNVLDVDSNNLSHG